MRLIKMYLLILGTACIVSGCTGQEDVVIEDTRTEVEQQQAYDAYDQQQTENAKEYEPGQ
jgi:hypothetical protein